ILLIPIISQVPAKPIKEPELLKEILARTKKDQDARIALIDFNVRTHWDTDPRSRKDPTLAEEHERLEGAYQAIDKDNTAWMKGVVEKHGWPGRSLVGKKGAQNAWLLVQHADLDRPFQKKCLELIRKMPRGEVDPENIAYLVDRVAAGEGK